MKRATALILLSLAAAPASYAVAQQQMRQQPYQAQEYSGPAPQDELRAEATAINARRAELFKKRDAAGIASMYTQDALYIELLPRLQIMSGHAQIQEHFKELFDARATDLTVTAVTSARMLGQNDELVGGEYYLIANNRKIVGRFIQVLRRDGGTWRIAAHVFARPEPVTVGEQDQYRGQ